MEIRDAGLDDSTAIAAIYNAAIEAGNCTMDTEKLPASAIVNKISKPGPNEAMLILERNGLVIGYGQILPYSPRPGYRHACNLSVFVREGARSEGCGTKILLGLVDRCRKLHYRHLVARIWADNVPSLGLVKKFGFKEVGRQCQIGFMDGKWIDIMLMALVLEDVQPLVRCSHVQDT